MIQHEVPVVAVVVAAGSGSRLGAAVPKSLVPLGGVPLVRRAVDALVAGGAQAIVVTVPAERAADVEDALNGVAAPVRCVPGGATRQESVRIGLSELGAADDAIVLVHDAARALIPPDVVSAVAAAVLTSGEAVVPVLPVVDSIREVGEQSSRVVDRGRLRSVQTPQGARMWQLRAAHDRIAADGVEVTDDAAACEYVGIPVTLVAGHRDAMKITEPVDLILAEALLAHRTAGARP
ncbi:2-C-methyl-D-erythritol 4-phosphate cytidylyltransferase [Tessaracoccus lapidicaptus]|uniref:2-C-methyl-D-erythritol 4-phosphate cytidylyltransferase n=1 Tax=Tessaracoccus lapidicaptus TaxID=1427523 RepID=A0A1C0ALZ2_9ACTN|nr:2-C-methyl-D-erythritol 4-phosphate cytidylyltransferase [Tessaracoccus lapidicaptus]OCL33770.1 2-C-methyl-D-erythritol 4-phosphate cytidylyltransferase [Tessaracoccus lapidicaptus]